ncbi:unnamed protein product [Bursaphelenchus okinawaensis]|uniref:STAS domain-containing protein n=1 Tax=Bursaphelenchus okinawaensis TaxID=465554 RepID=A0A811JWC1_9BILA|nr:unnamed protein product [Bursaphelenchus okinawaensis]CAG9086170.1 unnamed protein product [Bursaphelenchus okinawaensis]
MEGNRLLIPNPMSSSEDLSQENSEVGYEIMDSINIGYRAAMNQKDFDDFYHYNKPEHKHNEFMRRSAKILRQYKRPFRSPRRFFSTMLGFFPFFEWIPKYKWKQNLGFDFTAGCTLAVMHIPQGIAYAVLAGLPPISGLYLSLFAPLLYLIFGTTRQNSLGTFAVISLMTRNTLEAFPDQDRLELASTLSLTVGIVHLSMAIFRLDILTTYFSDAVIGGFSTGAACHVLVSQIRNYFGIPKQPPHHGLGMLFLKLRDLVLNADKANVTTITLATVCLIILVVGKFYINPFLKRRYNLNVPVPFELMILIAGAAVSKLLDFKGGYNMAVVGELPSDLPHPKWPNPTLIPELIPHAISIAAVVAAIHISLGKMLSKRLDYPIDTSQELYALGFVTSLSSIFPIYPTACSLSRTVVSADVGAKTQLSSLFSSIILVGVILKVGTYLETLPMCVLSSIIIVALTGMFRKFSELKRLWHLAKIDFSIWVVSFVATATWSVTIGLAISVVYALVTIVFRTQWPRWHYLGNLKGSTDFRDEERYDNTTKMDGISIFRFDAPLLFTNVEHFKATITKVATRLPRLEQTEESYTQTTVDSFRPLEVKVDDMKPKARRYAERFLVVDCSGFTFVDTMGANAMKEIHQELQHHRVHVFFAAAKAPVRELFEKAGYHKVVPKTNFFPAISDAVVTARRMTFLMDSPPLSSVTDSAMGGSQSSRTD